MFYKQFITEFDHFRSTYFDRKLVKDTLEDCVNQLKVKTEEEEVNTDENKSWYDWFRLECSLILTNKSLITLPENTTRRDASKEFVIGLLFVLNKLFAAWGLKQGNALSLKWEGFLDEVIPYAIRFLKNEKKESEHIVKLIRVWESAGMFSKKSIDCWKSVDPNEVLPSAASATTATASAAPAASSTVSTDHSTAVDSVSSKRKRKLDEDSTSTSLPETAPRIERQESSDGPEPIIDLRSAAIHMMHQFTHAMCKVYFDNATSNTDKVYWRLFEVTSFYLLHKLTQDYEFGEDEVSLCLASIYLAGKIENMFVKTEKLRATAESTVGGWFGADRPIPSDEEILRYETDLLQLIKYDINMIRNPVKYAQELSANGDLTRQDLMSIVVMAGQEEYLYERRYFEFHPAVSTCVLFMMSSCRDVKTGDSDIMRKKLKLIFESELFAAIDDRIQLIEMVSKVRKYSTELVKDSVTFYEQTLELFEKYSEIPIESIPAEYLYRKTIKS